MGRVVATLLLTALSGGCGSAPPRQTVEADQRIAELDSAMAGYLLAQSQRDWAGMNAHYAESESPEFEALMNGVRQDLAFTRSRNAAYYGSLREVTGGFGQLKTSLLAPDVGLVTAVRDQTMTDTSGVAVRYTGGASWVWMRRQGAWRIVHINSHFDQAVSN